MDTVALGGLAAEAMEQIAEQYGEDALLRTAALVLEIDVGPNGSDVLVTSTDDRLWVQARFLEMGIACVHEQEARGAEEDS